MPADPVREALRAATAEAETWQRDAAGRRRICPADAMERMTAAAVAAFLRALPEWPVSAGMPSREAGERLAAAVERAAKEAG